MEQFSPYRVLVVEDDPDHSLLIQLAFQSGDPLARVHRTARAEEAIAMLSQGLENEVTGAGPGLPAVVVLDLALPGIDGLGVLRWLAVQEAAIQDIPVIVFTSSDDPELARECFALGAREFKEKPDDFIELVEITHRVLARWRPPLEDAS